MPRTEKQLREDMVAIWKAGVAGVMPERLIQECVHWDAGGLWIDEVLYPREKFDHITIIGGGKASGEMAATLENILDPLIDQRIVTGWVNVPEDCVKKLRTVHLHGARPAGLNEPTEAGVLGTRKMLELLTFPMAQPRHLVIALISGGGSALLTAPESGISLSWKLEITRFLSAAGATIEEMNTVRKQLSEIKGGKLKQHCQGRTLVSLILSDVPGDPLDVIASGPTVENTTTAADAIAVLEKYRKTETATVYQKIIEAVIDHLRKKTIVFFPANKQKNTVFSDPFGGSTRNLILGNNATAVDAAGMEAERRGYSHAMIAATTQEGNAEDVGLHLLELALQMQKNGTPDCLISGGEPVVSLVAPEKRGRGGRNQQLVLAAMNEMMKNKDIPCHFGFLSGGTDGEDGPTDAAGAFFDTAILEKPKTFGLDAEHYLEYNDAYSFFEQTDSLLKTGPTGTNVCDLRVIVVAPKPELTK